jgi:putative hydrolase of the HAD superfamily
VRDDRNGTHPPAASPYAAALEQVRRGTAGAPVVVFDLDGVVREFDNAELEAMDAELGLGESAFLRTAFERDVLARVVTGRMTFAEWSRDMADRLHAAGAAPEAVARVMDHWHRHRGRPVTETVALIADLQREGRHTFVFTNGTDNVPAELEQIGLAHLLDGLINSADLGVAKPDEAAYAAAHEHIERRLDRPAPRADVAFVDDREENVTGAAAFGWRALHFRVGT